MSRSRPTAREIYFAPGTLQPEAEQERLEWEFFSRVRLRNGVFKTTASRRFDDLNALVAPLLPGDRPLDLMDIAVSSGLSTLEWVRQLESLGIAHRMLGGDASLFATLVSVGSQFDAVVDREGYPLHFDIFGSGMRNSLDTMPWSLVTGALRAAFRAVLALRPDVRRAVSDPARAPLVARGIACRPLMLVSPRLQTAPSLQLIEDDIIANRPPGLEARFHALRAANILNRGYFSDATLAEILRNLRWRLRAGGLLIVCRTEADRSNHGTIFRLDEHGAFEALARLGRGSEIEEVVVALR